MAYIIQYPNAKQPRLIIGLSGDDPVSIPEAELQKFACGQYEDNWQLLLSILPSGRDILFVVHDDSCYTFNSSWATDFGNGGYRITYNNIVIYENKPIETLSPGFRRLKKLILFISIAIALLILVYFVYYNYIRPSICQTHSIENEVPSSFQLGNDGSKNARDSRNNDTAIASKDDETNHRELCVNDQTESLDQSNNHSGDLPIQQKEEVAINLPPTNKAESLDGVNSKNESTYETNTKQSINSSRNRDDLFNEYNKKGLVAYQKFFETGNDEERLLSIAFYERAITYKEDADITKRINYLKKLK